MLHRSARENEEGALTSEPEFKKTQPAKSREIMRRNKHRIWYDIPETSDDDDGQKRAKTRKKTLDKRRTEQRARSRRKRSATSAARSAIRDSRNKSATRKQKMKPRRKRAQKDGTSTSILLVKRTEKSVNFEECNSSGESIRPIESAMSIRVVEDRFDFFEEFSDSRSSVDPDSSGESGDLRRKKTPDIESEEEVKPKKIRKGKTKNNAKDAKDKGEENTKNKGEEKKAQPNKDERTAKNTEEQNKVEEDKEQKIETSNRELSA